MSKQIRWDVNDQAPVRVTFRNQDQELQDPSVVLFGFTAPSGVTSATFQFGVDPELVKEGTGRYLFLLRLTEGSDTIPWSVRFEGDPPGSAEELVASQEHEIWVRVPKVVLTTP